MRRLQAMVAAGLVADLVGLIVLIVLLLGALFIGAVLS